MQGGRGTSGGRGWWSGFVASWSLLWFMLCTVEDHLRGGRRGEEGGDRGGEGRVPEKWGREGRGEGLGQERV